MTSQELMGVLIGTLRDLRYPERYLVPDWHLHGVFADGDGVTTIPLMAFWGEPFDQLRSAIAIVHRNGRSDRVVAYDMAKRAWSHVIVCSDNELSLWLLEQDDVRPVIERVSIEAARGALLQHSSQLDRQKVAQSKLRLRQYALYEIDPSGQAFAEWAIKPSATHAAKAVSQMLRAVLGAPALSGIDLRKSPYELAEISRWAFRLLGLRIGTDKNWGVAQGLGREDVTSFTRRALEYPVPWKTASTAVKESILPSLTLLVLEKLRLYDFSTIDPALIVRGLGSPVLKPLKSALDLFPTPRGIAWDMMSVLPLTSDQLICDPTSGTGTFLIAAGHGLWNMEGPDASIAPILRTVLTAGDQSDFATDLTRISLDLAFGWAEQQWNVRTMSVEATLAALDKRRSRVLVGNLPWSATGKAQNQSAVILHAYLKHLSEHDSGWIATITPRSIWMKRGSYGQNLRAAVASHFEVEHVWELGWGAIMDGRSQAVACALSRRSPTVKKDEGIVVWKREDQRRGLQTIGYRRSWSSDDPSPHFVSPDAMYFSRRLAECGTLQSMCDVRVGPQPRSVNILDSFAEPTPTSIPFVLSTEILSSGDISSHVFQYWLPESVINDDIQFSKVFSRPADQYRSDRQRLPQIVLSQHVYEGVHRLGVGVVHAPLLFSNRFFVCIPKIGTPRHLVIGASAVLNSVLGRLWLYWFASAGRDLAKTDLERFPLPPEDALTRIGQKVSLVDSEHTTVLKFTPGQDIDAEMDICRAYGFDKQQIGAMLGIGSILGLTRGAPRELLETPQAEITAADKAQTELAEILEKDMAEVSEKDKRRVLSLWGEAVAASDREHFLILRDPDVEVSLRKSLIAEAKA